ncbi:hypothetical protein C8R43DRAFT_956305 [Mycena crocata]|nr:hypothetical protein C8R43DRAFT_956267 [Mycena crocata]KAJ7133996.1 hypothetical protein C8R43DRAFT_956305 [Mycena crocata]
MQGMAQAVRFGARLDWIPSWGTTGQLPIGQTLLADGLKAVFTAYTAYCLSVDFDPVLAGAGNCDSHIRTLSIHWNFGNEYYLGWIAIVLLVGLVFAEPAAYEGLRNAEGLDAFTLGVDTTDADVDGARVLRLATLKFEHNFEVITK